TLAEVFEHVARFHPRRDTLNFKRDGSWISISSDEVLERARRIAAGLHSLGIRPGDRVAILSESRAEWTLADAGCIFAGSVDVPIYPTLTPPQVRYILNDSEARVLILANIEKFQLLRDTLKLCTHVEHVIVFEGDTAREERLLTLAELEERGHAVEQKQPR